MRILIVEDEVMIREGLAKLIKFHTGHTVIGEASNGQEGLNLAVRFKPQLVITDIRMPVMDGLQMIEKFHEMNLNIRAVILSGYSEFEYARKAIYYGVEDYLLKPLAAEDIVDVLERIEKKMEEEEQKNAGTPGQCIKELVYGGPLTEEEDRRIRSICGFGMTSHYKLYLGYTGEAPIGYEEEIKEKWEQIKDQLPSITMHVASDKVRRQIICLAALPEGMDGEGDLVPCPLRQAVERRIVRPYKQRSGRAVWAEVSAGRWEDIPAAARDAEALLKEAMPVTDGGLLTRERMDRIQWKEFHFPADISMDIKNALCRGLPEDVGKSGELFIRYMEDGPYKEQEIRQAYLKAVYLLLDTIREIDGTAYTQMQNADLLSKCTEAVTLREMEQSYRDGLALLCSPRRMKEDISNYTIKRAINYIREHYKEGISLEEVAGRLGITPEYLSTLFNREMGENFSTFLRKFRISHAKRLLKGTDMKVYEIAEEVGYTDPKYFARVFKEELGISPGDYRQQ